MSVSLNSVQAGWARLNMMSRRELWTRLRQQLSKRLDSLALERRLRLQELIPLTHDNQPGQFFFSPEEIADLVGTISTHLPVEARSVIERADRICEHRFDLLGHENLDYGPVINWHLDAVSGKCAPRKSAFKIRYLEFAEVGDHKVIWELNRHQHLVTLAKAYGFTNNERYVHELCAQWYHWREENPYPVGINWASSLEAGFRVLSWLWVRQLLANCPCLPPSFLSDLLKSLAQHGRHISRYLSFYFSPNTHLLGEAVALFFLGTMCPQIPAAAGWQKSGWEIILAQAGLQVQLDGMHFEQSIYYHVYALDLFLHARILAERNGWQIPALLDEQIEKMAEVLLALGQCGPPARIGDDDGGRVFDPARNLAEHLLDPLSTTAALYHRPDFKAVSGSLREETVWLLGKEGATRFAQLPSPPFKAASRAFTESGLYVMASEQMQLLARAGPMGAFRAGHSHCDLLSINVAIEGREILADPGTCRYVTDEAERQQFRGTSAHNTVRIDGADQAQAGDIFAWKHRPAVRVDRWVKAQSFDLLTATHLGYGRLTPPASHQRWIFHLKSRFWLVRDLLEGEGQHGLEVFWHLAPGLDWNPARLNSFAAVEREGDKAALRVFFPEGHQFSASMRRGWNSPAYGRKVESSVLTLETRTNLPVDFATVLYPGKIANARTTPRDGRLQQDDCDSTVSYTFEDGENQHLFFFAKPALPWTWGDWASDAAFLYCRLNGNAELAHLVLCDGTFAELGGHRLLDAKRKVKHCEWPGPNDPQDFRCSEDDVVAFSEPLPDAIARVAAEVSATQSGGSN